MRDGDYKLLATMDPQLNPGDIADAKQPEGWTIMQFIKQAKLGSFAMYDLSMDPSETTDISKTQPERFGRLKEKMIRLYEEVQAEGLEVHMEFNRR